MNTKKAKGLALFGLVIASPLFVSGIASLALMTSGAAAVTMYGAGVYWGGMFLLAGGPAAVAGFVLVTVGWGA